MHSNRFKNRENRSNSQKSSSDYYKSTKPKEYNDRLLLSVEIDQDMTYKLFIICPCIKRKRGSYKFKTSELFVCFGFKHLVFSLLA